MDNDNKDLGFRDFLSVSEMYQKWYIDYASYVILERAIPRFEDGLKPVQRRILHAMHNIDDGRFHKVANVIDLILDLDDQENEEQTQEEQKSDKLRYDWLKKLSTIKPKKNV